MKSKSFTRVCCPQCKREMFGDQLRHHLQTEHPTPIHESAARAVIDAKLDRLGNLIRAARPIDHPEGQDSEDPIGLRVLAGMAAGQRWTARVKDPCPHCKLPVVLLEVENSREKAFDVDMTGTIVGTHACRREKGSSAFAYQGGAIDSNRRRH